MPQDVEVPEMQEVDRMETLPAYESNLSSSTIISQDDPPPNNLLSRLRALQKTARFQLTLVAILSFLGPGMWNALNGIGGAGLISAGPANEANIALYTTFALGGFFGGIIISRIGFRTSFLIGELGYALYSSATLTYKHISSTPFIVFAGAQLGFSAGWFWTAQTATLSVYPTEGGRGKAVAGWGLIYNSGACVGSLVAFVRNRHSPAGELDDPTFLTLISLSILGALLSLLVLPPTSIVRTDSTTPKLSPSPSFKIAITGFLQTLRNKPHLLFILPMYLASNFFYPYQFNTFNLKHFTIRTRSLNNIFYWLAEIAGALLTGTLLDVRYCKRGRINDRSRALVSLVVLFGATCAVWGCALVWQKSMGGGDEGKIDYEDRGYRTGAALYAVFGLLAASYQGCLLWLLKPICPNEDSRTHLGGIFKGLQSAGAAVAFHLNTIGIAGTTEIAVNWGLLAGSILIAAPMVYKKAQNEIDCPAEESTSSISP